MWGGGLFKGAYSVCVCLHVTSVLRSGVFGRRVDVYGGDLVWSLIICVFVSVLAVFII